MNTLIYGGALDEECFLPYMKARGYNHFILYDRLPQTQHCPVGSVGYEKSHNEEVFLASLQRAYGNYTREGNRLFFEQHNMEYYINTDFESLETVPEGDIFISGYQNKNSDVWQEVLNSRYCIMTCNTVPFDDFNVDEMLCTSHYDISQCTCEPDRDSDPDTDEDSDEDVCNPQD